MVFLLMLLILGVSFGAELTIEKVVRDTLSNNLELKALRLEIKSLEFEHKAVRANLFPNIKLEEKFVRTDIPAYVLFTKLNQERIAPTDFTPSNLNDPSAVSNFETNLTLEIPIWMGGKIRAFKRAVLFKKKAHEETYRRKEEEVIFKALEAFLGASLSRSAIEVAQKNIEDAEEHYRLAQKLYDVGMALFSDVLRAQVFLKKAQEKKVEAESNYRVSMKALSLVANTDYEGYTVPKLNTCPDLTKEELLKVALRSREDIKALDHYIRAVEQGRRAVMADMLPQVGAFASYQLFDKDVPFGTDGSGYMFGLSVSLKFNTALGTLHKMESLTQKRKALEERKKLLEKAVIFSVEKAFSQYEVARENLKSAKARLKEAEEVVRIIRVRYENGLARMVDLLDAQTQLERARFDYINALYRCNLSYGRALLEAGIIKEVLK